MRIERSRRRAIALAVSSVVVPTALAVAAAPVVSADEPSTTMYQIVTEADGKVDVVLTGDANPLWMRISVRASADADTPTLYTTEDLSSS